MAEPATKPIVLVALGGHTFIRPGQRGTVEEQRHNAASTSSTAAGAR